MKKFKYILLSFAYALPLLTYAQFNGLKGYLTAIGGLFNTVIRLILGLALIFFFWGLAQFILHAGEQKARDEGKKKMLWGVIALFVFVSINGIIAWIGSIVGTNP